MSLVLSTLHLNLHWEGSKHSETREKTYKNHKAAAASVSDSVRPRRWQPTRLPRPWDSPGKNTGMGCHFLLQCMKVKSESEVAQSCATPSDPMDCSLPGSSVHSIFQQEYWSGVPLPSPKITKNGSEVQRQEFCFPRDVRSALPTLKFLGLC